MTPRGQAIATEVVEAALNPGPSSGLTGYARLGATTRASVEHKLSNYLLNLEHPLGGSKAEWFKSALGFTKSNMEGLAKQLVFDEATAVAAEVTKYGPKFEQVIHSVGSQ